MAANHIPPPKELEVREGNVAENWRRFKSAWTYYEIAIGIAGTTGKARVATLLSVIGQQAVDLFNTFEWAVEADKWKITAVLLKFEEYCLPKANVAFETYRFTTRKQAPGERIDTYVTELRKLAAECEFQDLERRLRDQVILGMADDKTRERVLREEDPTLEKVVRFIRSNEMAYERNKIMSEELDLEANRVRYERKPTDSEKAKKDQSKESKFKCNRCGTSHERRQCPAWGQDCNKCKQKNHFARCCQQKNVAQAETEDVNLFNINSVSAKKAKKTVVVEPTGRHLTWQVDTGADIDVLPKKEYITATGDKKLVKVWSDPTVLKSYGGQKTKAVGKCDLTVKCDGKRFELQPVIVDFDATPLLSKSSSEKMGLVTFRNIDQVASGGRDSRATDHRKGDNVSRSQDLTSCHNRKGGLTKDEVLSKYKDVFSGLGKLEGEYKIQIDESIPPVVHAARRVPVALREELKKTLNQMEQDGVIAKVIKPTKWVSSLLLKREPTKLRVCLDPKDLNKAIRREHHQLPVVEEVMTRLKGARVFTVADAKSGFWHLVLEEESSYLTTFNTPYGRYRWLRVPFGISSAPEVFIRRSTEFAEGLKGVEVVADDFLICGFGDTDEEAIKDHDQNLIAFLEKARKINLKFNGDKLKMKLPEVKFIGHILSKEGVKVDPKKVEAVTGMQRPDGVEALQRFLGMVQYLSKFLAQLSNMTKPLRDLTHQEAEWNWTSVHEQAFLEVKEALGSAPVLRYYDVKMEVTIQCDASQSGLGGVLMQEGQPVIFTSRAMTATEQRYAQIEKEMLAIVHCCCKFEQYIYGKDKVTIESDHKPLEAIFKKSIGEIPKRLQRMRLYLQKFNLDVKYKRGPELYIADTLSRAYLPDQTEELDAADILRLEEVSVLGEIKNSQARMDQIKRSTEGDAVLQKVMEYVRQGWPEKKKLSGDLKVYHSFQDELTEEDGILLKGTRVVIPGKERTESKALLHVGHMGVESTLRKAREYVYWPRMSADIKDLVGKCSVCQSHLPGQQKEPLIPHDVPDRAWKTLSADLFEFNRAQYIIVVDHFSSYFEYENLSSTTTSNVIKSMQKMFARYGIPEEMMTDCGPQFISDEFKKFAKQYGIDLKRSSPKYPQSNGKAENAVKICKQLMKKALESKQDFYLALLDYRNTPQSEVGLSPAQRMFGRRTRTQLPTVSKLLHPEVLPDVKTKIENAKAKQKRFHDRGAKELPRLIIGEPVRMKLPGDDKLSLGKCVQQKGIRSYAIRIGEKTYIRNRRQIRTTREHEEEVAEAERPVEPEPPQRNLRPARARRPVNRYGEWTQ